jgi:drug/metabolite transporter (DMT)-like permease
VTLVWPELTGGNGSGPGFLAGIVALQIASIGWSIGSSYSKRHGRASDDDTNGSFDRVLASASFQMLAGGLMMTALGTVRGEWSTLFFTPRTVGAMVYLATVGAIGGYVAYTYALRHLPVSFVSLYAYINPVIAVALGVLVLHEPFTARMAIAAALVFAGVAIVRWERRAPRAREVVSIAETGRVASRPA